MIDPFDYTPVVVCRNVLKTLIYSAGCHFTDQLVIIKPGAVSKIDA